jgi:hypothetical protein
LELLPEINRYVRKPDRACRSRITGREVIYESRIKSGILLLLLVVEVVVAVVIEMILDVMDGRTRDGKRRK